MNDWIKKFQDQCIEMKKISETKRSFSVQGGFIKWKPQEQCQKCKGHGIFSGELLDCGKIYETAVAEYCPNCKNINIVTDEYNTYWGDAFLSVMKKKLIEHPELLISVVEDNKLCPKCGGTCYFYHKDIGAIDFYDNYWTVCINPACDWPGEHTESHESLY